MTRSVCDRSRSGARLSCVSETPIFSNLNVGCNWHFNLGIDSIAHECVASGTKNALIVGTPISNLGTDSQGVLLVSSGTKGCNNGSVDSGLEGQSASMGSTKVVPF